MMTSCTLKLPFSPLPRAFTVLPKTASPTPTRLRGKPPVVGQQRGEPLPHSAHQLGRLQVAVNKVKHAHVRDAGPPAAAQPRRLPVRREPLEAGQPGAGPVRGGEQVRLGRQRGARVRGDRGGVVSAEPDLL